MSTGEPTVGWRTLASLDMQLTQTGYPREESSDLEGELPVRLAVAI